VLGQAEFAFCIHNNVNDLYELSSLVFLSESTSILYFVLLRPHQAYQKTFLVDQIH